MALAIVLIAFNLRPAFASLAPVLNEIMADTGLTATGASLLTTAPVLCLGLFGPLAPWLARRLGLERTILAVLVAILVGTGLRGLGAVPALIGGSLLAGAGIGVGNVLMPPLVRRYFPGRIGVVTGGYITVQTIGATVAPLIAVPVAEAAGWRVSLGSWSVVALVAAAPWVAELLRSRARDPVAAPGPAAPGREPAHEPALGGAIWRSPTAWAMAAGFLSAAAIAYVVFSAFPAMLQDVAHVDEATAGALVALFSLGGLPLAIVMPMIAARVRSAVGPAVFALVLSAAGFLGLLLAPTLSPWLWVACVALGAAFFPYALALVGVRSRTHAGSLALSGFMQAIGYVAGAVFPLLVNILHAVTGGWHASLVVMLVATVPLVPAAIVLARPRFVEDELSRRRAPRDAPEPPRR